MNEKQVLMHMRLGQLMDAAENMMRSIGKGDWTISILADGNGYATVEVRSRSIDQCHEGYESVGSHVFDFFDHEEFGGWTLDGLSTVEGYADERGE